MLSIDSIAQAVEETAPRYAIKNAALFGSYARGEASAESDVDIVIETDTGFSLLDAARFRNQLSDLLATDVDVLSKRSVREPLVANISKDQVVLYERA